MEEGQAKNMNLLEENGPAAESGISKFEFQAAMEVQNKYEGVTVACTYHDPAGCPPGGMHSSHSNDRQGSNGSGSDRGSGSGSGSGSRSSGSGSVMVGSKLTFMCTCGDG